MDWSVWPHPVFHSFFKGRGDGRRHFRRETVPPSRIDRKNVDRFPGLGGGGGERGKALVWLAPGGAVARRQCNY